MQLSRVLATDSGMHAVWDRAHFAQIRDYGTWEPELLEDADIERHIAAGRVVPININSDGAFQFTVRADAGTTPDLTAEERRRTVVASKPYRLQSLGHLDVSGIEYVHADPDERTVMSTALPAGDYEVRVHLLDWDDIAEKTEEHPDFVVVVGPLRSEVWGTSVQTFDSP